MIIQQYTNMYKHPVSVLKVRHQIKSNSKLTYVTKVPKVLKI